DPADRPRRDDGVERIVLEAVAVDRLVIVQVFRGHAGIFLGNSVIARSTCDEAIQSLPAALDCFASLAMTSNARLLSCLLTTRRQPGQNKVDHLVDRGAGLVGALRDHLRME